MKWKSCKLNLVLAFVGILAVSCAGMQIQKAPLPDKVEVPCLGVKLKPDIGETLEITGFNTCHKKNQSPDIRPTVPSPAQKAGMRKGDVITVISGVPVKTHVELNGAVEQHQAGDIIEVSAKRGNREIGFEVQLGFFYVLRSSYEISPIFRTINDILSKRSTLRLAIYVDEVINVVLTDPMFYNKYQFEQWVIATRTQRYSLLEQALFYGYGDVKNFILVDRQSLKQVIDEHKLSMSGIVSRETRTKLGAMLGLTHMIIIDYSRYPYKPTMVRDMERLRLIEIDTGTVLQSVKADYYIPY